MLCILEFKLKDPIICTSNRGNSNKNVRTGKSRITIRIDWGFFFKPVGLKMAQDEKKKKMTQASMTQVTILLKLPSEKANTNILTEQ